MSSSKRKCYETPSKSKSNCPLSNPSAMASTSSCNKTPSKMTFEDLLLDDDEDKTQQDYLEESKCIIKAGDNDFNSSWLPVPAAVNANISVEYTSESVKHKLELVEQKLEPVEHSLGIIPPLNIGLPLLEDNSQNDYLQFDQSTLKTSPRKRMKLDHLSIEEKIHRRKLKNRIAAQNARDRQTVKVNSLKVKLAEAQSQIKSLTKLAATLVKPGKLGPAVGSVRYGATPINTASLHIMASSENKTSEITDSAKIMPSSEFMPTAEIISTPEIMPASEILPTSEIMPASEIMPSSEIIPIPEIIPTSEIMPASKIMPSLKIIPSSVMIPSSDINKKFLPSSEINPSPEITPFSEIIPSLETKDSSENKTSKITASSKVSQSYVITNSSNIITSPHLRVIAPHLIVNKKPQENITSSSLETPHSKSAIGTTITTQDALVKNKSIFNPSTVVNQLSPKISVQSLNHNTSMKPSSWSSVLLNKSPEKKILPKPSCSYTFPKPTCSYANLSFLAIKNSPTGSLPTSQIYNFICEHFPYFLTAPKGWKNSVRHNLSMKSGVTSWFLKTQKSGIGRKHYGSTYRINPTKIEKITEKFQEWRKKNLSGIKNAMKYPELLESLEQGELKSDPCWSKRVEEDDEEIEVLDVDENTVTSPISDQEKCECGKQCQHIECGGKENTVEDLLSYIASPDDAPDDEPLPVMSPSVTEQNSQISMPLSVTVQNSSTAANKIPDGSNEIQSYTKLPENATETISELSLLDAASVTSRDATSNVQMDIDDNEQVPPLIPASTKSDYNTPKVIPLKYIPNFDISKIVKANAPKSSLTASPMSDKPPLEFSTHISKTLTPQGTAPLHPLMKLLKNISQTQIRTESPVSNNTSLPNQRIVYMKLKDSNKVVPVTVKNRYLSKTNTFVKSNDDNENDKGKNESNIMLNSLPIPLASLNIPNQSNFKTSSNMGNPKEVITITENSEKPHMKKSEVKNKSIASLFPSSFMSFDKMKSSNNIGKEASQLETHFTKSIACEDCGRVWQAVFVNIAVNLLCPDLDVFGSNGEFNMKEEKASAAQSWVVSMFVPKEDDKANLGLAYLSLNRSILTCVTPMCHTSGYVWRISHSGKGKAADSGCRIIPNIIRTEKIASDIIKRKEIPFGIKNITIDKYNIQESSKKSSFDVIDLEPPESKISEKLDSTRTKNIPTIKNEKDIFNLPNKQLAIKSTLANPKTIIIPVSKFKNPVKHAKIPKIISIKANDKLPNNNSNSKSSDLSKDKISSTVVDANQSIGAKIFKANIGKETSDVGDIKCLTRTEIVKPSMNSINSNNVKNIELSNLNHAENNGKINNIKTSKDYFNSEATKHLRVSENSNEVNSAENTKQSINVQQNMQSSSCENDKQSINAKACEHSNNDQLVRKKVGCKENNLNENNEVSKQDSDGQQKNDKQTFDDSVDIDFTIKEEILSPIKDGHKSTLSNLGVCDIFDDDIIIKEEFILDDDLERLLCDEVSQEYITDSIITDSQKATFKEEKMELEGKDKFESGIIDSKNENGYDGIVDRSDIFYKSDDKTGPKSKEHFEVVMPDSLKTQSSIIKREDLQKKRNGQKLNAVILEEKISKEELSGLNKVNAIELGSIASVQKGLYNTKMKSINSILSAESMDNSKGSNESTSDQSKSKENFKMVEKINEKQDKNSEIEVDENNESNQNVSVYSNETDIENDMEDIVDVENLDKESDSQAPDDEIFQIEKILKDRKRDGKREFLIKWVGYSSKHNSWEPKESFLGGQALINIYYEKKKAELAQKLKRKAKEDPVWHKLQDADAVPPVAPRPRSKARKRRKKTVADIKTKSSVSKFFETIPYEYKNCQAPSSDKYYKYIDSKYRDQECLYSLYNTWCIDNGFEGENETNFKEEFSKLGLRIHKEKCAICETEKERHKRSYSSFFASNIGMEEDSFITTDKTES